MIRREWWRDVVPAVVVVAVGGLGATHIAVELDGWPAEALTYVVVAITGLALLGRRRWPLATLVVVVAAHRRRSPPTPSSPSASPVSPSPAAT